MTLRSPKLDDRTFDQLMADALRVVQQKGIDWTDLSPGDPGIVLLELFAHLTEVMLYRLNRLPEKAYIEFLRLLGVTIQPPAAAGVDLLFSRSRASKNPILIPRGTRVTVERPAAGQEPPVFITVEEATILPDQTEITVRAYHCEQIEGELAGLGTSLPGQSLRVARPPIIAPTGDPLDLVVAVAATPEEAEGRIPAILHAGRPFRIWREVDHFSEAEASAGEGDPFVYVVDRNSGRITFAPAVSGLRPGRGLGCRGAGDVGGSTRRRPGDTSMVPARRRRVRQRGRRPADGPQGPNSGRPGDQSKPGHRRQGGRVAR
jgi:hypothetical protein